MASICNRCALRLQRAAKADTRHVLANRSFSSTPHAQRQLPTFNETSNPELDDVLATIREKHFIPAYLHKNERKLIFKQRYRQQLEDNPTTASAGGEEVPLQWLDRRREIPNRSQLVSKALNLMFEGDAKDWQNLPALLQGLNEGVKKPLEDKLLEKLIRKSIEADRLGTVLQCLSRSESTGLTLKNETLLRSILVALHFLPQSKDWSKSATEKALRDANVIAAHLESEEHGTGRTLAENDPRTRPEVVGVFLELAAVYAYRFSDAKDESGLVKAYAERLVSCLEKSGTEPSGLVLQERGAQWPMLLAVPVWHGLSIAQAMLRKDMPKPSVVSKALATYEVALSQLAAELEARSPQPGTYDDQALTAWKACIRP